MEFARAADEPGIQVPAPFARSIKVLFAPDRGAVEELSFQVVLIDSGSQTDYHVHDRPELIYVVSGDGVCVVGEETHPISGDAALYIRGGEWHQLRSTGVQPLKIVTVFVPAITAEDNYERVLSAARAAASGGEPAAKTAALHEERTRPMSGTDDPCTAPRGGGDLQR